MNGMPSILLIIFSSFTMNLMLQAGLGIQGAASAKNPARKTILIKLGIIFTAVILIWIVFSLIISSVISGLFIYILLFPVSSFVYNGLDFLIFRYVFKKYSQEECPISFPDGITAAASFICLNIANNFREALSLSFGFAAGTLLVFLILGEIRRRAALESVPRFLRGKPLVLVSMGMLSLVFSVISMLLFRIIGN